MAPRKKNPLNLNSLQLKTLVLFQTMAHLPQHAEPGAEPGSIRVGNLPHPHDDHFHLGDAVVAARDATGLGNEAVWVALERKGLIRSRFPWEALVTEAGLAYDTGLRPALLRRDGH
jgi:hypothetical protein